VREVQAGVWWWDAPHPEWSAPDDWTIQNVSSYAIDTGDRLLLFDPLALPSELEEVVAVRETAIVLTSPWHRRDAVPLAERLGIPLYVPPPDRPEPDPAGGHVFRAGDRLPIGVEAFEGVEECDLMLWVESHRALVTGDRLLDPGDGLVLQTPWLPEGMTREEALEIFAPLLELPVELVLPTHGRPTDGAALERALSA
jgi:glyoxylase-like metal-dependent hydrolase (beta-lactamase superfamily II)